MEEKTVESNKRRSLRGRILTIVILIAAASLAVTSMFGIFSMLSIEKAAEDALVEQATDNLKNVIDKKTELADLRLDKFREIASVFTYYVQDIMAHPDEHKPADLSDPATYDTGELVYSAALASEKYDWETLKPQAEMFSHIVHRFYPVLNENKSYIKTVYFGFDNGLLLSYDKDVEKIPPPVIYYDFLNTDWYTTGKSSDGFEFTGAYTDGFGRGLTITCVCPIHDENGTCIGVLGMDMSITELYDYIMSLELGDSAAAFLLGDGGKIISLEKDENGVEFSDRVRSLTDSDKRRMQSFQDGITIRDNMCYAFSTIKSLGWKLCVRVPQSHVLELANTIDEKIFSSIIIFIIFFLIILATVVVIVFEFSQKITKPITDLMDDISEISSGDLDHRAIVHNNDEIGDLAVQFNEMAGSLKEHIDSITVMTAEKERISAELGVATKIQMDMMPTDFPRRREIEIFASMTPAKEVGGDFYDFFMIDSDHIGLVMADVSGKGVPACLFMVITKTLMKIRTSQLALPSEMMWDINNTLCADNAAELFVTAWFGVLTVSTGEIVYVNAGHEYPAIKHKDGSFELIVRENMPPLAADENIAFRDERIRLEHDDVLFLYTDGVTDAKSPDGKRFGMERMLETLNRNNEENDMKELLGAVQKRIEGFMDGADQFDDITMMGIIWHGRK